MATLLLAEGMKRSGHGSEFYARRRARSTPMHRARDETPRCSMGLPQIKVRPRHGYRASAHRGSSG
jgi:hypothetical protein